MMIIESTKDELLPALLQAGSLIERRQTLPILGNFLMVVQQGTLTVTATDLELEVKHRLGVIADDDGAFTVPARKLMDICKALDDEAKITLQVSEDKVTIRSGRGRYTLSSLPASDYPNMESSIPTRQILVPQDRLKQLLEKTAFAMAHQDVRYYLNGMLFETLPGKLRTVATDGHRLALCDASLPDLNGNEPLQAIVPRKAVVELNRLLDFSDELPDIELQFSDSYLKVEFPQGSFTTKLIDGRYPDYLRVIPSVETHDLTASRNELKKALVRTSVLSNEKFRGVRFAVTSNLLTLTAHNPEHEEAEEELEVSYTGPDMNLGFNVNYLLDVLNVLGDEEVRIQLIDSSSSCIISAESEEAQYVVMPMRI